MRTSRLLVAIFVPVVVVACAVGTAPVPEGSGEGDGADGGGATTSVADGGYGTTGDSGPVSSNDSGTKTDSGTAHDGGTTPIDSGSPVGKAGLDCSGKTSMSGESYDDECDDLLSSGDESDCSSGGGECGAGTCCRSSTECNGTFLGVPIGDFASPQCVPQ